MRCSKPYDIVSAGERQLIFKVILDGRVVHGWITFEAIFGEGDSTKINDQTQLQDAQRQLAMDVNGIFCAEIERQYRKREGNVGADSMDPISINYLSLHATSR